ncbi:hypothetical protein J4Q44_G00089950 [Coregonus suidteri]|uniref:Uncharacterized protein n=1 Tax=Coregonus suidteri TaxID=861788 RepID=A0AAN8LW78_9TELE
MDCFCFPAPRRVQYLTRQPTESQKVGLFREKVTLMWEAIKILKSDQEAMMAQLKKSQKKQQKDEKLLHKSQWKQGKDNQQLCLVIRRLENKVDVVTKELWAELKRLGELIEENKNGAGDSSASLKPCWEFPIPVPPTGQPRPTSGRHQYYAQYPCVPHVSSATNQSVSQTGSSRVLPAGQRLHRRCPILPPLVDPPMPITHWFPDLSPPKRPLPLPPAILEELYTDTSSDPAFRQEKVIEEMMKILEEEREKDRVDILAVVEKEMEKKLKKLQRESPAHRIQKTEQEMVEMMKAIEKERELDRIEILEMSLPGGLSGTDSDDHHPVEGSRLQRQEVL